MTRDLIRGSFRMVPALTMVLAMALVTVFVTPRGASAQSLYLEPGQYKRLALSKTFTIYPFVGFSFVGESYSYDGGPDERAAYLARNLGMHAAVPLGDSGATLLRFTVEEQAFRRETYRAARIGIVRRF
jgi:hypothetical protein